MRRLHKLAIPISEENRRKLGTFLQVPLWGRRAWEWATRLIPLAGEIASRPCGYWMYANASSVLRDISDLHFYRDNR
jgi:hypothetical protein